MVTYDFVRAGLRDADRGVIEADVRRNAWFFAAHLDWGLREVFPGRLRGDYRGRAAGAANADATLWVRQRVDSNGDCRVDGSDDPASYPTYAYVRADGSFGPRVPELAMWFNNRRSANALAFGMAGLLLGDVELVSRAKRYFMEWLTYSVWPDGSTGEYARNGEYCVAREGLIYASMSVQGGLMLAQALARHGDRSLVEFATTQGMHGTESRRGDPPKSLSLERQHVNNAA